LPVREKNKKTCGPYDQNESDGHFIFSKTV
jgi:hypothetical protein